MSVTEIKFTGFSSYEKGRVRNFRYDINALAEFEQMTGMGFGQLMSMKAMFATCRALLYSGLKHEDRTLTPDKVGDLIQEFINDEKTGDDGTIEFLTEKCLEAAVEQGALGRKAKAQKQEADARKNAPVLALAPPAEATPSTPASSLPVIDVPVGG